MMHRFPLNQTLAVKKRGPGLAKGNTDLVVHLFSHARQSSRLRTGVHQAYRQPSK
jgi:hypothetical protein